MKFNKIYIFGGTGSGKTTLAKRLSNKLKIPYHSTDDFIYKGDWESKYSENQRDKKLKEFIKKKKWIIEGVHKEDWILPAFTKADIVIMLSLPRYILLTRILKREIKRKFQKKSRETNLKETLKLMKWANVYKNDNFIHHQNLIKNHKKEVIILKNKKQIKQFLGDLK